MLLKVLLLVWQCLASPPGSLLGMFLVLKYLSRLDTVEMSGPCRFGVFSFAPSGHSGPQMEIVGGDGF